MKFLKVLFIFLSLVSFQAKSFELVLKTLVTPTAGTVSTSYYTFEELERSKYSAIQEDATDYYASEGESQPSETLVLAFSSLRELNPKKTEGLSDMDLAKIVILAQLQEE